METRKKGIKRIITLFLTLAMVITSLTLPSNTVEAASKKEIKSVTLSINKTKIAKKTTLYVGEKFKLTATVNPSSAKKSVAFKSSNTKVLGVDKKGTLTAKKAGKSTVTVTATPKKGKKKTAKVAVTVSNKLSLNKKTATLEKGKTLKLNLKPSVSSLHTIKWTTSNSKAATVDKKGVVKAKDAGSATITATVGKVKATAKITVPKPADPNPPAVKVTGIVLEESNISLDIGETKQLTAAVQPDNAANKAVSWKSSDTKIVAVSDNGLVEAKAAGNAQITVTTYEGAFSAICDVKVNAKEEDGLKIEIPNQLETYSKPGKSVVMMGNDANVQVRCIYNGSPMTNANIKLTMEPQYGNLADAYAIRGVEGKDSEFEKTNENGYVTFPVSQLTKYKELNALSGAYQSYKLTVTCQDNGLNMESSAALCFASVQYSTPDWSGHNMLYVANLYDDTLPEIEPSLNATGSGVASTMSKNGEFGVQYVTSQQVSTEEKPHAVTLAVTPVLTIPATTVESNKGTYEQIINHKSGSYSVYNDESNTETTTIIKEIPAGLEWARMYFNDIQISQYTKIQITFRDPETHALLKTEGYDNPLEIEPESFTEDSKVVQIPVRQDQDVYVQVALISAGQIDEDKNTGYDIGKIVGEWASNATDFYEYANLENAVTWEKDSNFARSTSTDLTYAQAQKYLPGDSKYLSENNTYMYRVPAFPSVGNAVLDVKTPDQKIAATFLYPSENLKENNIYQNKNVISPSSSYLKAFNASGAEVEQSVGTVTPNQNSVTIDSIQAGYTPLKATIDYSQLGVKTEKTVLYTSVQWSPIKNNDLIETQDFYAVKGQQVEVTLQLYDKQDNKVTQEGEEIKLLQGEADIDKDFIVGTPNYTTNKQGNCTIKIKNPSGSRLSLEDLNAESKSYNVKLMIKSDQGVEHANIYWADLGLYFCSDVLDSDEKSAKQTAFLETTHSTHKGVVETKVFTGTKTLGKYQYTQTTDTTDTKNDISLARSVGQTWTFGVPVVGYVREGVHEKITSVSGVNVAFIPQGVGEKIGEDNTHATYTMKSEKTGDSVLTATINSDSLTDNIIFTILDESGMEKLYPNVGTGTAEINASVSLVLNWMPVGMKLNIIPPLGGQLDVTTKTKVYFTLKDDLGNPLSGKEIAYSIDSLELTALKTSGKSVTTNDKGVASIDIAAPGKEGRIDITATYDSVEDSESIVYQDCGVNESFVLKKAAIDKTSTPYKVEVEFSHALDAKTLNKDAFHIYKTASPTDDFKIADVQINPNDAKIAILTLDGEGLKDIKSSDVTLSVTPYEDTDEIEYQIIDINHRLLPDSSAVVLEDKK